MYGCTKLRGHGSEEKEEEEGAIVNTKTRENTERIDTSKKVNIKPYQWISSLHKEKGSKENVKDTT